MSHHILSTFLLLLTYAVNYLSSNGYIGESLTELGTIFPFSFMPPWRVFGLARGLIYLFLGVYVLWWRTKEAKSSDLLQKIAPRFRLSCIANMWWLILTGLELYAVARLLIATLRWGLLKIVTIIKKSTDARNKRIWQPSMAFGLYLGRVTLATNVVGISQVAYVLSPSLTDEPWRIAAVIVWWFFLSLFLFKKYRNRAQLCIAVIAFLGIALSLFQSFA